MEAGKINFFPKDAQAVVEAADMDNAAQPEGDRHPEAYMKSLFANTLP